MMLVAASPSRLAMSVAWFSLFNAVMFSLALASIAEESVVLLQSSFEKKKRRDTKIVFGLFTSPKQKYSEQLDAVLSTWAQDVVAPHELLVVGVDRAPTQANIKYFPAPECPDGSPGPGITCKEATLLTQGYDLDADWVVVGGTDNYIFPQAFEVRLSGYDVAKPQILGIFGCGQQPECCCSDGKTGLCGGGGYAISRAALRAMIGNRTATAEHAFVEECIDVSNKESQGWSDQVTSCIARRHGIDEIQLSGLHGWREDLGEVRILLTTPGEVQPLTFHYVPPDEMPRIHQMAHASRGPTLAQTSTAMGSNATSSLNSAYTAKRLAYVDAINRKIKTGKR
eukprot:TRINITY_DN39226_c0_g1_i1.p1 TRINITY_DN39226_c0_g1~~TRINITY_DN39226_c0_g1_i1.p1  ORF type:complete len:340 (-),score=38.67 TRINITY_DN39226_c0_g1_i1:38-1057(-)